MTTTSAPPSSPAGAAAARSSGDPVMPVRPGPERIVAVGVAVVAAGVGVWAPVTNSSVGWWVGSAVVVVWSASAAAVAARLSRLGLVMAGVSAVLAVALAAGATFERDASEGASWVRSISVALVPAAALLLSLALPDGRLGSRGRRVVAAASLGAGLVIGIGIGAAAELPLGVIIVEAVVAATASVAAYARRCRAASARDRARLQWMGWGVVVAATGAGLVAGLHWLVDVPASPGSFALGWTAVVPLSFVASTRPAALRVVDRVLVATTVVIGLTGVVAAIYLVVVVGLGRVPEDTERNVLILSMVAAAVAAVVAFPARRRLEEAANQRIYGERESPDEVLRTFSGRMTRALPMDELLLQLVETLRPNMALSAAEVWTGTDGVLERTVSLPDRGRDRIVLRGEELQVVARSRAQGNAWLSVWIPDLIARSPGRQLRVAAMAHQGELMGLIVAERDGGGAEFDEEDDQVLSDLARQVGLALHNVRLDSALQASLDELQVRNTELQASRRRIVTAADESRRAIERNLHDGAQQHLVAMAVKLGLARQIVESDPETAAGLLEELRGDVQDTLGELRELAHGIFPPLLRDRGLAEALRAAANRSPLPVEIEAAVSERFPAEVEAAVYFCCLEALQNAGKYAGSEARVRITIHAEEAELRFEVGDDGPGFDAEGVPAGHGFENMRDRLGAIGGELVVDGGVGRGARVGGRIPRSG